MDSGNQVVFNQRLIPLCLQRYQYQCLQHWSTLFNSSSSSLKYRIISCIYIYIHIFIKCLSCSKCSKPGQVNMVFIKKQCCLRPEVISTSRMTGEEQVGQSISYMPWNPASCATDSVPKSLHNWVLLRYLQMKYSDCWEEHKHNKRSGNLKWKSGKNYIIVYYVPACKLRCVHNVLNVTI